MRTASWRIKNVTHIKEIEEDYMLDPIAALNIIVEILEASEGHRIEITLDDGDYEIKLNKLGDE